MDKPVLFLAIHYETGGLPRESHPVYLSMGLFSLHSDDIVRFDTVCKYPDIFRFDPQSTTIHYITEDVCRAKGSDGKIIGTSVRTWLNWLVEQYTVIPVVWDADTVRFCEYRMTGKSVPGVLGSRVLWKDCVDVQHVSRYNIHTKVHEGNARQYDSLTRVCGLLGKIATHGWCTDNVTGEYTPTRNMINNLITLFKT